tara:strand:+ start:5900 stop:6673 length:774 start_codon:yes stop_codon:yes gene_type:complete
MTTLTVSQELPNPQYFRKNMVEFVSSLRTFFERRDDLATDIGRVPHYRVVRSRVEKVSYASLRETKVYVPAGLAVNYKTYLAVLEPAIKINEGLLPRILNPFARWLAEALNNPEQLKRISASSIRSFEPHNLDKVLEEMGECFDKGSNATKVPFKQAFARNSDVKDVLEDSEKLTSRFIAIDRKQVIAKVDEISDNLDVLIARIEEGDAEYDIGGNVEKLLSQLAYTMAREVEFYGSVAYQLTQLTTALEDTAKAIR